MAGKKRKLKKELKRKLRKDIKKDNKDKKVDKSKVEKQVLDNQTLQQIMMAQMMSSRDRIRKGEDVSWITVQNQANADRIQDQQKINDLKAAKKEWERKAKNIEENEKYKEIIEKYEHEVEEHKRAIEQAKKIIPLQEQLRELEAKKAELEQKLNDPVIQKEREAEAMKNYIKHMEENLDPKDPDFKEKSDKIADLDVKLKKYKQQEELSEELNQIKTELKRKESERKAAMEYLRKEFPDDLKGVQYNATDLTEKLEGLIDKKNMEIDETNAKIKSLNEQQQILDKYEQVIKEFNNAKSKVNVSKKYLQEKYPDILGEVNWDAKNIDEIMLDLMNKAVIERDNMNKQIEMLKETSEEMKILNQTKRDRDIYEENFKRENPLFNPIYEEKLREYGENITPVNKTNAFIDAYSIYTEQMKDNIAVISTANEELRKSKSYGRGKVEIYKSPDNSSEDDNPDTKVFTPSDINNEYVSSSSDSSKDDESSVAPFGPGRE